MLRIAGPGVTLRKYSMGFPSQEHWSRLPFPSPGDLSNPEIEPRSPALQAGALPSEPPGKPQLLSNNLYYCSKLIVFLTELHNHDPKYTRLEDI